MKSVRIWSFSGPLFPATGLNSERHSASLLIQSEYGKIRTIKTPNTGTFHAVYSCLKFWILKTYLKLSPLYLMPPKEVIALFPKAVLCYNFRSACLHYNGKDIHKPSYLTCRILHTKKIKLYIINCHFWFMADDIENRSFLTFETLNLVPSSFFLPKIGYWLLVIGISQY